MHLHQPNWSAKVGGVPLFFWEGKNHQLVLLVGDTKESDQQMKASSSLLVMLVFYSLKKKRRIAVACVGGIVFLFVCLMCSKSSGCGPC
jgi:hypothetical protein